MKKVSFAIFLGLGLLCIYQAWHYYPQLPERVASHFGPHGHPDSWTTKKSFIRFYLLFIAGITVFFSLIGLLTEKVPASLMNMPNKEYWMAPERRQSTLDLLASSFFWFASATMILLLDMFYQTFQVQLGRTKILTHPVLSLGIYISFSVILTLLLLIGFFRKKK